MGFEELEPQPYWGFDDLFHKAGTKLLNCFYIIADVKKVKKVEYFCYSKILVLENLSLEKFLEAIEEGVILIDFDTRTGHNYGKKFRIRQNKLPQLYERVIKISD